MKFYFLTKNTFRFFLTLLTCDLLREVGRLAVEKDLKNIYMKFTLYKASKIRCDKVILIFEWNCINIFDAVLFEAWHEGCRNWHRDLGKSCSWSVTMERSRYKAPQNRRREADTSCHKEADPQKTSYQQRPTNSIHVQHLRQGLPFTHWPSQS